MDTNHQSRRRAEAHLSSGVSTWKVLSMTVVHCRQRMMKVLGLGRSVFISWHSESHTGIYPEVAVAPAERSDGPLGSYSLRRSCWADRPSPSLAVCPCIRWKSRLSSVGSSAVASSWCTLLQRITCSRVPAFCTNSVIYHRNTSHKDSTSTNFQNSPQKGDQSYKHWFLTFCYWFMIF